jgi:hypothetical protein
MPWRAQTVLVQAQNRSVRVLETRRGKPAGKCRRKTLQSGLLTRLSPRHHDPIVSATLSAGVMTGATEAGPEDMSKLEIREPIWSPSFQHPVGRPNQILHVAGRELVEPICARRL